MEEKMTKIMRKSIFIFLKYFHYFSTTPVLLLLPFSALVLISSQALSYSNSSPFPNTHAAGFPAFSKFVLLFLNKSFYQTFFSSILIIPFSLSSFLIAKASIIQVLKTHHEPSLPTFSSCFSIYKPLLLTHLCNMLFSITANIVAIFILFIASGFLHGILQLLTRTVLYAFLTQTIVLCNLALVVSGMENCTSYRAIYNASILRRGTNSMALFLALPTHLALASIEALFCYRVIKDYDHRGGRPSFGMALESMLISYLYSIVIVIDTIASWVLLKGCTSNSFTDETNGLCDRIKLAKEENSCHSSANLRILIFP
ncbi:hypothetical protein FEM48_Zijuj04G0048000 [Ziziphus jujuba var. spinosa]|uniref:Uncharacterized protein n=1 Tax=Ziziphus jujuba var. spinosa TaxID=714518 RepID=A0A978VHW3_ZIZJJ|nr:hypothetical protein FEM48_Zijuj04G0048000 [Ziziphus jujuba var. spinosa]